MYDYLVIVQFIIILFLLACLFRLASLYRHYKRAFLAITASEADQAGQTIDASVDSNTSNQLAATGRKYIEGVEHDDPEQRLSSGGRIKAIGSSQILAAMQVAGLKLYQGVDKLLEGDSWLKNAVAAYLIGIATETSDHYECDSTDKEDIISFVLKKNLGLSFDTALPYQDPKFVLDSGEEVTVMYKAGREAAHHWLTHKKLPEGHSLYEAASEWGIIG